MSKVNWWLVAASTGIVALIIVLFLLPVRLSAARDFGQWNRSDPLCAMAPARFGICEVVINIKDDLPTLR